MIGLRRIVLCADDYGLSPGVSRGIRELLGMRRLSATSCMVVYPEFAEDGPLLRPFLDQADIGLHFTLTTDRPLSQILVSGWLRRLAPRSIREVLARQLETFVSIIGHPPAYIDGHQHVHLLPGAREAVIETAAEIGAYVRSTREPIGASMFHRPAPVDSIYLSWMARPVSRRAHKKGVRTNAGFRGVRSFTERRAFRELFCAMISGAQEGSIVMCHPGHVDAMLTTRDPIRRQRGDEFTYLASDEFPRDLAAAGLELAKLGDAMSR
jgi:predicted glycoside hydrolase/deacetylase ChbG (UPF0249 family)